MKKLLPLLILTLIACQDPQLGTTTQDAFYNPTNIIPLSGTFARANVSDLNGNPVPPEVGGFQDVTAILVGKGNDNYCYMTAKHAALGFDSYINSFYIDTVSDNQTSGIYQIFSDAPLWLSQYADIGIIVVPSSPAAHPSPADLPTADEVLSDSEISQGNGYILAYIVSTDFGGVGSNTEENAEVCAVQSAVGEVIFRDSGFGFNSYSRDINLDQSGCYSSFGAFNSGAVILAIKSGKTPVPKIQGIWSNDLSNGGRFATIRPLVDENFPTQATSEAQSFKDFLNLHCPTNRL